MMIHAYKEIYLDSAVCILSEAFDYMVYDCNFNLAKVQFLFLKSEYSHLFEIGSPNAVAGLSGTEFAKRIVQDTYPNYEMPEKSITMEKSPEYWCGWALAQYQWYSGKRFSEILERIPLTTITSMYSVQHEMDIEHFYDVMQELYANNAKNSRLKRVRESRGLSQSELAKQTGVNIRNIQMYEQYKKKIDYASCSIVYKLAYVLGCRIEDLLEEPLR